MQDLIFGLLLLGTLTGVIPALLLIAFFQLFIGLGKAMGASAKVLKEREAPVPVVRNIREELWDERDADTVAQFLQDARDGRENAV